MVSSMSPREKYMLNKEKYLNVNYIETKKSKEWMNKNLPATGKSPFIREAVAEKINRTKIDKNNNKLSKDKVGIN